MILGWRESIIAHENATWPATLPSEEPPPRRNPATGAATRFSRDRCGRRRVAAYPNVETEQWRPRCESVTPRRQDQGPSAALPGSLCRDPGFLLPLQGRERRLD